MPNTKLGWLNRLKDRGLQVDVEDEPALLNHFWGVSTVAKHPIIYTTIRTKLIYIHRFILGLSHKDKLIVDHISGDRYDNRKSNLRVCTNAQNCMNQKVRKGSKYKGVQQLPSGRWRARVTVDGNHLNLGTFTAIEEAALAYNIAALRIYGEFARLNEI